MTLYVSRPLLGICVMVGQRLWDYGTRIVPALSSCSLAALLVLSLAFDPLEQSRTTIWQWLLGSYIVLIHVLSVFFPLRAFRALGHVTTRIRDCAAAAAGSDGDEGLNQAIQNAIPDPGDGVAIPLFIIIIPAYKEDIGTLQDTLQVLATHACAKRFYHVYLALEEREISAVAKAKTLVWLFNGSFYRISWCLHPQDLPGEVPGKSSNESWASKQASIQYSGHSKEDIIVTVMDSDTHLSERYFSQIAKWHTDHRHTRHMTIYVPPIVFDRNIHQVPLLVRIADILWAGAGISCMYPGSRVCIPTSVYSLSMALVERVGHWDVDACAIGEDMHMYLKCFFALSSNLHVQWIPAAASQCNISTQLTGIHGYLDHFRARYMQALRHMWGSLDTGYTIRQCVDILRRQRQSGSGEELEVSKDGATFNLDHVQKTRVLTVILHVFEAHFLPIHLAFVVIATSMYNHIYPEIIIPSFLKAALEFSTWCRLVGYCSLLCFFYRYERYHRLCVSLRLQEMYSTGLSKPGPVLDNVSLNVFPIAGLFEAILFPVGGFIFGALPALQAVVTHVFTDRLTYAVSLKTGRQVA